LCKVCECISHEGYSEVHCTEQKVELNLQDAWPPAVRSFSLTHANLTQLPKLPNDLKHLSIVSLAHNAIIALPDNAFDHFNLSELNLAYNGLTELNGTGLMGMNELEILHLEQNNFETIDWEVLNGLVNLKSLYLQDNYIKMLDGRSDLKQLKVK
jgi:Leucine-rich repeat (LRR) protein